ncbi:MAG: lysylphosphatidylglycerol synthase transmembrane domain-containing protein [Dehalococcoidia bacterium]
MLTAIARRLASGRARTVALQVALSVAAIAVLVWQFDVGGVPAVLAQARLGLVALGLVAFTASKVVHAYRWRLLLRHEPELTTWRLVPVFLVSNLANALIPLRAGDVLRVEIPSRRYGVARGEVASSVFIVETVTDWLAFAILLGLAALVLDFPAALRPVVAATALGAVALFLVAVAAARRRAPADLERSLPLRVLPERWREPGGRWLLALLEGMRSLRDNRHAALAVAAACLAWAAELPVWWLLGHAFGLSPSLAEALVLMTAANLVVALPLTPWDVGPYELLVSQAYVLLGAGRAEAAAFAIGSHLVLQLWIGVTGMAAMWWLGLAPREVLRRGDGPRSTAGSGSHHPDGESR